MTTLNQVMATLEKMGSAQTRKTYERHGANGPCFGIKIGDLKPIAKQIKGNQESIYKVLQLHFDEEKRVRAPDAEITEKKSFGKNHHS